jgi:PIN domain nuclease of toxin-antitoxin system
MRPNRWARQRHSTAACDRARRSKAGDLSERFEHYVSAARFRELPVTVSHALAAGKLPGPHKNPFGRMLIVQSLMERIEIVSGDPVFADYGAQVIWR